MSDKPATVLVCVMDMSHNEVQSGGNTDFNQNCNFNVNGTQSSVVKDNNPASSGGFPFGITSSMSYLDIWEQTKLILATNLVLILIVVGIFIIIMFVLWNYA